MTTRHLMRLVRTNVRRARRQFLLSSFGIAVGIAALAFFLALSSGVRQVVIGRVFHADRIDVEPAKAGLASDLPLFGGGPRLIDDEQVAALRAIPGVRSASPRARIAFPAKAWGGRQLFGSDRYAEVLGDGLDPAAVAGPTGAPSSAIGPLPFADLERGDAQPCDGDADCTTPGEYCAWDVHRCAKPVPALISPVLVELYNSTFAPAHRLPRIGDFLLSRFKGFTFTIELGQSFMGAAASRGVPRQRRVMLVGVSDKAVPIGLSFPLPYVQRWNAEYAGPVAASGYSAVTIEVSEQSTITRVAAKARALGLTVTDSGAEQAGLAITLVSLLFGLVSLAILAVAVINIVHTFYRSVAERRRELGVLRAVGATRGDIRRVLLGEAAAVGLVGGAAGLVVAWLTSLGIDLASRRFVPDFPFKPESYFHFSPWLCLGAVGFAVLACVLGALLPARTASRLEPADALSAP